MFVDFFSLACYIYIVKIKEIQKENIMNSLKSRLLSLILALSIFVSCFSILAFADETDGGAEGGEDTTEKSPVVAFNRDFADGWTIFNGASNQNSEKGHKLFIDKESTADYGVNYFSRFEAVDTIASGDFPTLYDGTDGFVQMSLESIGYQHERHIFVEFDLMIDDLCNLGNILYFLTEGTGNERTNFTLLGIVNEKLRVFGSDKNEVPLTEGWHSIIIDFDYETVDDALEKFNVHITVDEETFTQEIRAAKYGKTAINNLRFGIQNITNAKTDPITDGQRQLSAERAGHSWCIDNLAIYCHTDRRLTEAELDAQGYGQLVDPNKAQSVIIDGVTAGKSTQDYLNESLCMKLGVEYALSNGVQTVLASDEGGAPAEYDGQIVVPLIPLLKYMGTGYYEHEDKKSFDISTGISATYLTIGRDIATVSGEVVTLTMAPGYYTNPKTGSKYVVIALDDVERLFPGYYVTYDAMGLIIIGAVDEILNREYHMSEMLTLMNRFIYNFVDPETVYELAEEKTNNFTHPYILGNQEDFDRMTAIYNGTDTREYDVDLKKYITAQVDRSFRLYELFSLGDPVLDENGDVELDGEGNVVYGDTHDAYHGLDWSCPDLQTLNYPHVENFGYDPYGGRQAESGTVTNWAYDIAFGYAVTGDIKLAQLTYEILVAVGEWNHWCPGHFLNCADAAKSYAIAFDWIYQGIAALESGEYDGLVYTPDGRPASEYYSNAYLEELLYKNGVRMGYLSSTRQHHGWPRYVIGAGGKYEEKDVWLYSTMGNNWNAVCTSGMWIASLALLGSDNVGQLGPTEGTAPVKETAAWLISDNLKGIANYGMGQYAPDGSYVESPGYWGYGTNSLYFGLMALWSCLGDDFGLLDAAGMDKTCYFACNVESSDYRQFAYHDSSEGSSVDSKSFYFVAEAMDDPVLAEIRKIHNNNGKGMNITDFFFYPYDNEDAAGDVTLPLDYYMEGIDAFTARSSWDKGALFAGIIAGDNSASHGQIDSGSFIYHNNGVIWITDLGADEYNIYNYFTTPDRYRYYRMNAEGNNVLALTSQPVDVPYGQKLQSAGDLTEWFSNEFGSYAIVDNTAVYGTYGTSVRRGMLLTNNRKTLVIQDEANFSSVETLYWCAHFNDKELDCNIVDGGRTMYLYQKDSRGNIIQTLRLSIVSRNAYEKFVVTSAGETPEDRLLKGDKGTVDYGWSTAMGALVSEKSREDYKRITVMARTNTVQMAVVIELITENDQPLGYSRLTPMNEWVPTEGIKTDDTEIKDEVRGFPNLSHIKTYMRNVRNIYSTSDAFTTKIDNYYYYLTYVYYIQVNFYPEDLIDYEEDLLEFEAKMAEYMQFVNTANVRVQGARNLALKLMGV